MIFKPPSSVQGDFLLWMNTEGHYTKMCVCRSEIKSDLDDEKFLIRQSH